MKKSFVLFFCLLGCFAMLAQAPQKSHVKSSREPWRFGLKIGGSYDDTSVNIGCFPKFGFRTGVTAEKHLVYNLYFQPSVNFVKKGFKHDIENHFKEDINAMYLEVEASLAMKFGDERLKRGFFLNLIPYYTFGIAGKSEFTDLNPTSANLNQVTEYKTFERYNSYDIGFKLGAGYDFNKRWTVSANYTFGMNKFSNTANLYWRGWSAQLMLFF